MMSNIKPKNILAVEDNPADVETIRRALNQFKSNYQLEVISDGKQAKKFTNTSKKDSLTSGTELILLDLNLPGIDGRELLELFDESKKQEDIPIVVLTTSKNNSDIQYSYRHGANAYLIKPGAYKEFMNMLQSAFKFWLSDAS